MKKPKTNSESEIDFILKYCGDLLISFIVSAYIPSYFILASYLSLKHLSEIDKVYLDMTWFERKYGVFALSEKFYYSIKRNGINEEGMRCITWAYIYTQNRDNWTITEMFTIIKAKIFYLFGVNWRPSYFCIDFDFDIFFFFSFFF